MTKPPRSCGLPLKKQYGQNFLRDKSVVHDMLDAIDIKDKSVFEIGCNDGFLTREIIAKKPERLWVFEIDPDWAQVVEKELSSSQRFSMYQANFLDIDFSIFDPNQPWFLLSNLPYHVTFPILKKVQQYRHMIPEGVVMMQEEVAQKIVKTGGRGYGYISLFFQHYFEWKLLTKVPPIAFYPAPKVFSRLIHFKARTDMPEIPDEQGFWKFIKICFAQPRRTFRNNLQQTHFDSSRVPEETLKLRSQQMDFNQLLELWKLLQ